MCGLASIGFISIAWFKSGELATGFRIPEDIEVDLLVHDHRGNGQTLNLTL